MPDTAQTVITTHIHVRRKTVIRPHLIHAPHHLVAVPEVLAAAVLAAVQEVAAAVDGIDN